MGVATFEISPILTIIQRFVPRVLAGWVSGWICMGCKKLSHTLSYFTTGFCAAALNTVLFMLALVLLFTNTDYLQNLMAGKDVLTLIFTFVGVNAVVEMLATTAIVGTVCKALERTRLFGGK